METFKLNETPVRTSRNFNINNITIDHVQIPEKIGNFDNVTILAKDAKIEQSNTNNICHLTYGVGINQKANQKLLLKLDKKNNGEIQIGFGFNKNNRGLVDHIEIEAEEQVKGTIIIKYETEKEIEAFHNGTIRLQAKKNSKVHVYECKIQPFYEYRKYTTRKCKSNLYDY